ncbi:hypothetical protein KVT40_001459 [Elsinoe batatas]|uniref:Uncharacterized protein n=1 Tax=Elsinoe batatas TaxID=2601811 RepID=A0A8K0L6N8_9PEZI|nr:hypothetical protein KVT40_001459 [Elsinoe batatas]
MTVSHYWQRACPCSMLARTETQSTVSHGRARLDCAGTKGCGSGRRADPGICKRTRSSPDAVQDT